MSNLNFAHAHSQQLTVKSLLTLVSTQLVRVGYRAITKKNAQWCVNILFV